MNIFIGNLPFTAADDDLREAFAQHGSVDSARVIKDRDTGRSRGFGFVEMDDSGAEAAIEALNGSDMGGRSIRVNQAEERKPRGPRTFR